MIPKICLLLMLSVAWEVSGASFSNVYVQTGPEATSPVEYLQYGTPSYAYAGPEIAQYAAAPVGYEYPLASSFPYGAPCTKYGCFYPGSAIAPVAEVKPSANIVEFTPPIPNVPVVYAASPNEQSGYKYSYVVVDQGTGDNKAHSEMSDGGEVRGEYAYLQPDGFVREVQYVANDAQGFNAIIKNFMPDVEVKLTETAHQALPCHDHKNEALTILEVHGGRETDDETPEVHHKSNERHGDHESRHGSQEESEAQEGSESESEIEKKVEEHENTNEEEHVENDKSSEEVSEEPTYEKLVAHEGNDDEQEKPTNVKLEIHEGHTHELLIQAPPENYQAVTQEQGVAESNVFVSYNDIIKCIQAAMAKVKNQPSAPNSQSPLTYLVFNKPC